MTPETAFADKAADDLQQTWIDRGKAVLMNTYASHPIVLESGHGSYVQDVQGKHYLDFISGIAVNSLGHTSTVVANAVTEQVSKLGHCSNLFLNIPAIELAETLTAGSPFQRAFFCNSGAEAIEGSFKLSRKYAKQRAQECTIVLTMSNSFHGRTYGSMSLTAQTKYHQGYHPLVPDVQTVQFNDIEQVLGADLDRVAAIILEPIQGEGGIHCVDSGYLQELRQLCNDRNIVLIFDEIQCGVGRSGTFFAWESAGVEPDVIALAKGLGGGFPIGAFLAKDKIAQVFKPGDHGSTFGGNPLACAAALACVKHISDPSFLKDVRSRSEFFWKKLIELRQKHALISDIRGQGLLIGVEFTTAVKPLISACIEKGFLVASAGDNVMRLLPPLTVSEKEILNAVSILDGVIDATEQSRATEGATEKSGAAERNGAA